MSIGWIVVSFFTLIVAIAMGEIVSAIPTSGGPYFWSAMMAPPRWSPFAAWITGWFNLLGQVAVTTGISFGLANLIATIATVKSNDGYEPTPAKTIGIYAAVLISHGLVNSFGVSVLKYLNNVSIVLHSAGVTALAIAVLAKAPKHQSAAFVFGYLNDGTGVDGTPGWSERASPAYIVVCGSLLAQYTCVSPIHSFIILAAWISSRLKLPTQTHRLRRLSPSLRGNPQRLVVRTHRRRLLGRLQRHLRPTRAVVFPLLDPGFRGHRGVCVRAARATDPHRYFRRGWRDCFIYSYYYCTVFSFSFFPT